MEPVIRQRLVGTLVLLALGVVFWPIIFVQPEVDQPIVIEPMPPRPKIDESPLPTPRSNRELVESTVPMPTVDPAEQAAADEATLLASEAEDALAEATDSAVETLAEAHTIDPPKLRSEPPAPVERDAAGFAKSWVLQVATVSSEDRARKVVTTLQSKGYEAFHRSLEQDGKTLWRVQIGPKFEREKFAAIKAEVDKALRVDSRVIRYTQ